MGDFGRSKERETMDFEKISALFERTCERKGGLLCEHEVYELLMLAGINVPTHSFWKVGVSIDGALTKFSKDTLVVAKVVLEGVAHKTDIKGIEFNLTAVAAKQTAENFTKKFTNLLGVLFVEQVEHSKELAGEFLISLFNDPFFGPLINFGFGGTATEYYKKIMRKNASHAFISVESSGDLIKRTVSGLPVVRLATGGVRGVKAQVSLEEILSTIEKLKRLGAYFCAQNKDAHFVIEELEINPACISSGAITALDGVMTIKRNERPTIYSKPIEKVRNLLSPKTVAIAGVSGKNSANPSNIILKKFIKAGISRENIFLIHPKEEEIEGIKCLKNIDELMKVRNSRAVDCLVVGLPAKIAGPFMVEAFEKYVAHTLQIISSGFAETKAGEHIQEDLDKKLAQLDATPERRPLVNGPNTLGNIYHNVDTLFTPRYKSSGTGKGASNVAFVCQSGAFMITRISDLADIISPKIAVSVGNQMDLSVTDVFEYLLDEKEISTYGLYIEGLNQGDGIRLMRLVRKAKTLGKFVVIYKAGRSEAGISAAKGHTAAMAGDYAMFVSLLESAGAIVTHSASEFDDVLIVASYCGELLVKLGVKPGKKFGVAALSNAGYEKCALADHLFDHDDTSFELANYTEPTRKAISEIFSEHSISSIVDIQDVLDLSPMMNDDGFEKIVRASLSDDNVDFGIYTLVPDTVMLNTCEAGEGHKEDATRPDSILNRLINTHRDSPKPFVTSIESGYKYDSFAKALIAAGVPCFRSADVAARAVSKLLRAFV